MNFILSFIGIHILNRIFVNNRLSRLVEDEIIEIEKQRKDYEKSSGLKTKEQQSFADALLKKENDFQELLIYIKFLGL